MNKFTQYTKNNRYRKNKKKSLRKVGHESQAKIS